ncbi:hypothetical protein SAMN05216428_10199 [Nitrosospira sp. Nsp11]|nr:hypothetical protein SAMN05216428_10199 [Nitrosospira sp. Nsp11]
MLGTLKPLWAGHLPNLPYLPYLFLMCTHAHTHTRTRVYACVPVSIIVGKVRKVRKNQQTCGVQPSLPVPNLNIG